MSIWEELAGQPDAVATFRAAAEQAGEGRAMTHSWLITGPPGSGRSNLAFAFATALLSPGDPDGDAAARRQVAARTHPDLAVLSTDLVIITIKQVRELVQSSNFSPSVARFRVVVIEDADRMSEHASDVLLKALEEPPPRTVWVLCAPSEADLLPTVRSRVRSVRLRIPAVEDVARLIEQRDGVDPATALRAAREAQSHIGMAHRLATSEEARARRAMTLRTALGIRSVAGAVAAAGSLLAFATDDAKSISEERGGRAHDSALRSLGVEPGGTVPPRLRAQLRELDDDQKRRSTRSVRDGIDRIMVDLLSLYRDILLLQLGVRVEPINVAILPELQKAAEAASPEQTLATMDAIATARTRIEGNVPPALALEAMLVSAVRRGAPHSNARSAR